MSATLRSSFIMFEAPRRAALFKIRQSGNPVPTVRKISRGFPHGEDSRMRDRLSESAGNGGIDIESGMVDNCVLGGSTAWRGECRRRGKTCPLTKIEKGRDSQWIRFVVVGQVEIRTFLWRSFKGGGSLNSPSRRTLSPSFRIQVPLAPAGINGLALRFAEKEPKIEASLFHEGTIKPPPRNESDLVPTRLGGDGPLSDPRGPYGISPLFSMTG